MAWGTLRTSTLSLATAANRTLTLPASIVANELIFITMNQESDSLVSTTCTGYTLGRQGENATPGPDEQYVSFWKFAVGGETTAVFAHASVYCSFACVVIPPPAGTGTPALDVQGAATTANTTATTVVVASITTLTDDAACVVGVVNYHEDNVTTWTSPWTTAVENTSGASGGVNAIGYQNKATAGSLGTCTVTFAASVSAVGCQHAFKPGAGGAAPANSGLFYYRSRNRAPGEGYR